VDCNYCYKDFPAIIKGAGLNGFPKPETAGESAVVESPVNAPENKRVIEVIIKLDGEIVKSDTVEID
jgi:hypothetical protein